MERNWEQLAEAMRDAREARGLSQVALAELANVSPATIQNLESGKQRTRTPVTLPKVEEALGWEAGTAAAILSGAAPDVTDQNAAKITTMRVDEFEDNLLHAVTSAAIAVADNLTAKQINELSRHVIEDLQRRGVI